MHQHDIDLIQALAEGELTGRVAETAADAIAACPQCSRDLDLQVRALEALTGASRVYLSAAESARLRSAVRRDLKLGAPATETPPKSKRSRFRLGALAGAAALLLAVVGVAPQLDLLGSGDQAAVPIEELGEALGSPVTVAGTSAPVEAAAAAPAPAAQAEADTVPEEISAEERTSAAAAEPQSEIAAPPELTDDIDLEELRKLYIEQNGAISTQAYLTAGFLAEAAPDAATGDAEQTTGTTESSSFSACDPGAIPDVAPDAQITVLGVTTYRETPALVVANLEGDDPADVVIVVQDAVTCQVLARL